MANICFTILHYRTPFIHKLSVELERRGHSVFFLCPSHKWRDWLISKGVNRSKILDQTHTVHEAPLTTEEISFIPEVIEAEKKSGLTLNSMILMDRLMREWDGEQAQNHLIRLFILIKDFLKKSKIDIVIGEATPANELLTSALCEQLKTPYYFPITTRIPDGRFAFFKGRFHTEFAKNKNPSNSENETTEDWATHFLESFKKRKPKPSYWHKNNKLPKIQISWALKLLKTLKEEREYGKTDPTRFGAYWLLRNRTKEVINRFQIRRVNFKSLDEILDEDFILYPLHKQPESSVDVLGDFYSDQLNLLKQIVRSLPTGYKLYVKEHSNAIGDRPLSFYRELESLPNVRLISPYEDSFKLLERTKIILTISGTMAYEAGLMSIPAITFSKMFFNNLPSVKYCHAIRDLPKIISEQLTYDHNQEREIIKFLANLYENSFEGTFSDINAYPEIMKDKNIEGVCNAIESIL